MPRPSIGRIVHYRLTTDNVNAINRRREDAKNNLEKMRTEKPGFQAHVGSEVEVDDLVSMTITQVWGKYINLVSGQATLDGNDSLWITDTTKGKEPGQWEWPERLPED